MEELGTLQLHTTSKHRVRFLLNIKHGQFARVFLVLILKDYICFNINKKIMTDVYNFLLQFHSGWAYLVLILTVIMLLAAVYHFVTKKPLHRNIRKVFFYTVLSFHIQFLVGLIMYIMSPKIQAIWESGEAMSNKASRLLAVEHPAMMFTAVILITIANAKLKKSETVAVSPLIFLVLALVCFYMIPWTQWMA